MPPGNLHGERDNSNAYIIIIYYSCKKTALRRLSQSTGESSWLELWLVIELS